jgi:phosphatidylethanolamine-binding protein (PEBP) family uncharacterized protein
MPSCQNWHRDNTTSHSHQVILLHTDEMSPMIKMASPIFANQEDIPQKFTSNVDNFSPAIAWTGVPVETKSLVLTIDDPDAPDPADPVMTRVH